MEYPFTSAAEHFDWVSENDGPARRWQRGFHHLLACYHRNHIAPGSSVLDVGCGAGELLDSVAPSRGLGIDISPRMIERARARGSVLCEYRVGEVGTIQTGEKFDYILASFLTGYLPDIQSALENLLPCAHDRTRLVLTSLNTLWLYPLKIASRLGMVMPQPPSNWLSTADLVNLLELAGWEVISTSTEIILPFRFPGLSWLANRVLTRIIGFRHLGSTLALIARPRPGAPLKPLSCSVIVPARNEAGNIRAALDRIPVLGQWTEVVFVEGNSRDATWKTIQDEVSAYRGPLRLKAIQQPGKGKWDAVRAGFEIASGEIFVIQDADLTAPPEDLPKFYNAVASGRAEFANGSRLVYPLADRAMRFLNLLGNKFFALSLSYVLGQPIKDSLCGTKMLLRSDYIRIQTRIKELGDFDPFGDFNLLFGASLLDLKIRDIPVRYKERSYGETNISRFSHGWLLMKMTLFGLFKLRWR